MKTQDEALTISNPRILSAAYFSLLAIIATIALDTFLYAIGIEQFLPVGKAIILAVIIAAIFGALFGERIVHSKKPYSLHVFFWAFLMVILAVPVYDLGFLYLLKEHHGDLFAHANLRNVVYLYLLILAYSFILAGVWLAIIAGLAAIFLRGHIAYDIVHAIHHRPRRAVKK